MQIERSQKSLEPLEHQSLDRHRAEDDRERQHYQLGCDTERRWKRRCRSERDRALHAGQRNIQAALYGRSQHPSWRMKTEPAILPSRGLH
jgi:hypothetical protein